MIKVNKILKEGAIQLTSDERRQVEEMLPKIIKIISGKYLGDNRYQSVGYIDAVSADKSPIKIEMQVGNDLNFPNAGGYYQTNDKDNPTDNVILIQQNKYAGYFKGLSGLDLKLTKIATGNQNPGVEKIRSIIKHEIIHAKDPALNHKYRKERYDTNDTSIYYKSWTEFQTMTGQFFEAITTGVDRALALGKSKEDILSALGNILNFYAGKEKFFTQNTKDFIQGTGKRNVFQSLINYAAGALPSAIDDYYGYIALIKKYNPEGYKEFLTDLYKTIEQAKENLNNIKEMKHINEVIRMQKLAGILTESHINEDEVFDIEAIKKQLKDKVEQESNLDEALGLLGGIGLVLAIPALLQGLSTLIEKGNRQFTSKFTPEQIAQIKAHNKEVAKTGKGHKEYTSDISKELDEYAHWLHDMCLKPIEGVLWVATKIPIVNRISWIKDDNKRHKLAEAIYLVIAIAIGGYGVASHAASVTGIIDAVKLGDAAIDTTVLANRTGLLKNLPSMVSKLIS